MSDDQDVRWGLAQRFEFIEWRAYWNRRVNRKDLEDEFHISTPQASLDFKRYQEAAPGNIEYDATEKTYVATGAFRPKFLALSAERYLRQLQALKSGAMALTDTWFGAIPTADAIPSITRAPEPYQLRDIIHAIETGTTAAIDYLSLQRVGIRTICPHALAHDGYRWHVRAFSLDRQEYRDYVLARIISVSLMPDSPSVDASDDVEWNTFVKLRLVAHPGLRAEQRKTIEHDYRMRDGKLEVQVRAALALYFIRRHDLDLRDHPDMPPERAQLSLENLDEVQLALEKAKEQSLGLIKRRQDGDRQHRSQAKNIS